MDINIKAVEVVEVVDVWWFPTCETRHLRCKRQEVGDEMGRDAFKGDADTKVTEQGGNSTKSLLCYLPGNEYDIHNLSPHPSQPRTILTTHRPTSRNHGQP